MLTIVLTQDEAAVLERLFNSISGLDNVRAIIPIYDKMIAAAKEARTAPSAEVVNGTFKAA